MLFIPVLIAAIILYIIGQRVLSTIIFFFFLFEGFQVVPDVFFNTFVGISKSIDFAFIYVAFLFCFGLYRYDDFIPKNNATKYIVFYLIFILISCGVSLFYYHVPIFEIIKTSRAYLFVLSYYVLRRLNKDEIDALFKILFIIVCFQCFLFVVQVIIDVPLLTNANTGDKIGFIRRYYNLPIMILFMFYYAIFNNPFSGVIKWSSIFILCLAMILPLHRSLIITFLLILVIGILLNDTKKFLKYMPILFMFIIPTSFLVLKYIGIQKSVTDIVNVANGDFMELDDDFVLDSESTLMFRMLHFFERYTEVTNSNMTMIFGEGFMSEGSEYTNARFDFQIGLVDDKTGSVAQLETSDISWSVFIIRFGFVGTFVFLFMYFGFIKFFYKNRNRKDSLVTLLYLLIVFALSFTSASLSSIISMIIPLMMFEKVSDSNQIMNKSEMG